MLAALLVWAPMPFGGVTRGGQLALQLWAFTTLAAALASGLEPVWRRVRKAVVPGLAIAGVAVLGVMQSMTWPASVVARVSPEHERVRQSAGLAGTPAATLSLAPSTSRTVALTWLAAAAVLIAAATVSRDLVARRIVVGGMLGGAVLQVAFGGRHLAGQSGTIWGVEVPEDPGRLRGTFVNPDHCGTYLLIALAVTFACGVVAVRRARERPLEQRIMLVAGPVLGWGTLFLALAFTGSRGAMVGATVGTLAQGVMLAMSSRRRSFGPIGIPIVMAGVVAVTFVGFQEGLGRWLAMTSLDASWEDRRHVYGLTVALWRRFPLLGSGLATFRDAFPLVQPRGLEGSWWHAHSDVLELLATTGVVGGVMIAAGLLVTLKRLAVLLVRGSRTEDRAMALAGLGALCAIGFHETVDFGLTMPATAFTLVSLLGAALAIPVEGDPAPR